VKVRIALYLLETHHRATERHLPYEITQCYLRPDTGERAHYYYYYYYYVSIARVMVTHLVVVGVE